MSTSSLKSRVAAEHRAMPAKLARWAAANDPLTRRLRAVVEKNLHSYLPAGAQPESGDIENYSSLIYDDPEIAERAFAKHIPHVYSRNGMPGLAQLIEILRLFDRGTAEGCLAAHGMAAVAAAFEPLGIGDHIVVSKFIFGSSRRKIDSLRNKGVAATFIDGADPAAWRKAVRKNTKLFWFETPGNPTMEIVDIEAVAKIAHGNGRDILVAVDNSLAFLAHNPLKLGADIEVVSLTKPFGLGRHNGGAVLMSKAGIARLARITGDRENNAILNDPPLQGSTLPGSVAASLSKNAVSLPHRARQQQGTAARLVKHIAAAYPHIAVVHPTVKHPQIELARRQMTGNSVFPIDLGSREAAFAFIRALGQYGFPQNNNLGGPVTTTTHPASTTHSSLTQKEQREQGIGPGLVRLSVGIEDEKVVLEVFDKVLGAHTPVKASAKRKRK